MSDEKMKLSFDATKGPQYESFGRSIMDDVLVELEATEYSVEYAGCGSHKMRIKARLYYYDALELFNSLPKAIVADEHNQWIGVVTGHNYHGVGEVIVQFFDGSADSMLINELNFPFGKERALEWLKSQEQ